MNTPSNAIPDASFESQAAAPAALTPTRPFLWAVRRELWENRSIYLSPLAVAGLTLFGFLISLHHVVARTRTAMAQGPMQLQEVIEKPYDFAALLLMGTTFLVSIVYCLDALYGERRDRSILFWKSMPVSDLTTVLSKAAIPVVVLPLVTFAVTVVTQTLMLMLNSLALAGSGIGVRVLTSHLNLFHMQGMLLYHLLAIHGLMYAPIYGWLLLVSAWAKRLPFLWAALPPLAIGFVEKIAFNTTHFANMLADVVGGGSEQSVPPPESMPHGSMSLDAMTQPMPGQFLSNPDFWIGLIVAALFLAAAVRVRRHRGPI
jgi:ABC-2 type transport system permease protein